MPQRLELAGLGSSLAFNAYRTLKSLLFSLNIERDDRDLLCGIEHELRFLAGNNIIEILELDMVFLDEPSFQIDSEDWSALDSLLTESGGFPMLHRVSIELWWYSGSTECLNRDKFPRLVESKAVTLEFDFKCQQLPYLLNRT